MFEVTVNLKHNTMLKLCYGMGLRLSEIVNIKTKDIDSKNMQVFIEKSREKRQICKSATIGFRTTKSIL